MSKRVARVVAPPAREARHVGRRAVALVHEAAADRARSRVEVLVAAPDGEIGAPVVQRERHVADRVRKIEADARSRALRRVAIARGRARSPVQVLHARQQHERDALAVLPRAARRSARDRARAAGSRGASSIRASAGSRP